MKNFFYFVAGIAIIALSAMVIINNISDNQNLGLVQNSLQTANLERLTPPSITTAATSTGTMPADTFYLKVTSLDHAGGQTAPSAETTCITEASEACNVTLSLPTEAASSRLWVATTSGVYYGYQAATSTTLVATTTALTQAALPQVGTAFVFNSGENLENSYLQAYVTSDTLVKSGRTFVHSITYSPSDAAATAGSIAILDATAAGDNATTTLYSVPAAAITPTTVILDQVFTNGLYVDFTTTDDVNVSISYK